MDESAARDQGAPRPHAILWEENKLLAQACLQHPFIQDLMNETLTTAALQRHLRQEPFFWHAMFRACALAAAKCRRLDHAERFGALMSDALRWAKALFAEAQKCGRIDEQPQPAMRAYVDFLMRTAWANSPGEISAALAAWLRVETEVGVRVAETTTVQEPFFTWVQWRAGKHSLSRTKKIEALLDELADDLPRLSDTYHYALACRKQLMQAALEDIL